MSYVGMYTCVYIRDYVCFSTSLTMVAPSMPVLPVNSLLSSLMWLQTISMEHLIGQ